MRVILQVTSGPSLGRRIPLQVGEIARFGSRDTADVCFPNDNQMSQVHFELECRADRCVLRDLSGSESTLLNEDPVSEAELQDGDVIRAGQTTLSTSVQGGPRRDADKANEGQAASETEAADEPLTAAKICQLLDLSEESQTLLLPEHTPDSFIDALIEHNYITRCDRGIELREISGGAFVRANTCYDVKQPILDEGANCVIDNNRFEPE